MSDLSLIPCGWGVILAPKRKTRLCGKQTQAQKHLSKYRPKRANNMTYWFHAEIDGTEEQATRYARTLSKQGYRYIIKHGETHRIFTNGMGIK